MFTIVIPKQSDTCCDPVSEIWHESVLLSGTLADDDITAGEGTLRIHENS